MTSKYFPRQPKKANVATKQRTAIIELFEWVFSMRSVPKLYKESASDIRLYNKIVQATSRSHKNHENERVHLNLGVVKLTTVQVTKLQL
jgi:hypothetical protein